MNEQKHIHVETSSEEIQEIITAIPSWIVRYGITLVFVILGGIILFSALIRYPDVVKTNFKINSTNSPIQILAKQNEKITTLLVNDGQQVKKDQVLAYFETTANPNDVLKLNQQLKELQRSLSLNKNKILELPNNLNLGEFQSAYQNFHQQYLQYQSTLSSGYYLQKMLFLKKDLSAIKQQKSQITKQQQIQQQEYANNEKEYQSYQKLYEKGVISRSEFTQQENKYLAAKYPLQQTDVTLLNNLSTYSAKEKELLDLNHTINEEQAKFVQSLNQTINESEKWITQYVLRTPIAGKLSFAGIIQPNQNVFANQEIFIVNPGNSVFFGEMQISQYNIGKVHAGAHTLMKLSSYPFEQYGMVTGTVTYISDAAYHDSIFVAKVRLEKFEQKDSRKKMILKNGMQGNAEIVALESSLLQRFFRSITKMMKDS